MRASIIGYSSRLLRVRHTKPGANLMRETCTCRLHRHGLATPPTKPYSKPPKGKWEKPLPVQSQKNDAATGGRRRDAPAVAAGVKPGNADCRAYCSWNRPDDMHMHMTRTQPIPTINQTIVRNIRRLGAEKGRPSTLKSYDSVGKAEVKRAYVGRQCTWHYIIPRRADGRL